MIPSELTNVHGVLSLKTLEHVPFMLELARNRLTLESQASLDRRVAGLSPLQARLSREGGGAGPAVFLAATVDPSPVLTTPYSRARSWTTRTSGERAGPVVVLAAALALWAVRLCCLVGGVLAGGSVAELIKTSDDDLDVIRKMASRCGDGVIATVLNKLGFRTGKGKPWSQLAVKTARRNHGVAGRVRSREDPEVLTRQGAARYTSTRDTTIKKLVEGGVVPMRQVVPFAPWEIARIDVDSPRVRAIPEHLKRTGRVVLGDASDLQAQLFQ